MQLGFKERGRVCRIIPSGSMLRSLPMINKKIARLQSDYSLTIYWVPSICQAL